MATRSDLVAAATAFREQLYRVAQAPNFSAAERDGFLRLHDYYRDRLAAFEARPRYDDASVYYDNPEQWATRGAAAVPECLPGDPASQRPVYDAANGGGASLDAVTAEATRSGLLSFRSSLLVSAPVAPDAAPATAAAVATAATGAPSSFGAPPAAPPTAGADAPPPPSGPTPPTKKTSADPPWFAKLMTMFPAEAVTAYLTGSQYFGGGRLWLVVLTLVAVVVVRWVALMSPDGRPNLPAVIVSSVSFLLWVGATVDASLAAEIQALLGTPGNALAFQQALAKGASFVILLWTWVLPALIKIDPAS